MRRIEELVFRHYAAADGDTVPAVFILGSPRTGSTLLYQVLINTYGFFYMTNLMNDHFAKRPILGAAVGLPLQRHGPVPLDSAYGKTAGLLGPSEGSALFRRWFGGAHPSQTRSCAVLADQEAHFLLTMKSLFRLTGRPLLAKNAWNCFRIRELKRLLPNAHFVWIRRDLLASALSDLEARYRKGSPGIWNSATTADYEEIQRRPYWEQVVEQQYAYNLSIAEDLAGHSRGHYVEVWYEDLCSRPEIELARIGAYFAARALPVRRTKWTVPSLKPADRRGTLGEDESKLTGHLNRNLARLGPYLYANAGRLTRQPAGIGRR